MVPREPSRTGGMGAWRRLVGNDPVRWLLDAGEPAARWVTLTAILGRDPGGPAVQAAHRDVIADPATRALAVLHRIDDLAPAAITVDVRALPSSKGGTGTAVPP